MSDTTTGPSKAELEKAASVRLFEKVAAANDVDLNTLDDAQLGELYEHFETNVLPSIMARHDAEKQAAAVQEKLAGLSEEQVYELFEKQAAAEPDLVAAGGLDALDDGQLKLGFAHFVENVLPIMAAQDFAPVTPAQAEKIAAMQEEATKIAEAELLGRHMARGWWDEHDKIASARAEAGSEKDAGIADVGRSIVKEVGAAKNTFNQSLRASAQQAAAGHPAARGAIGQRLKALGTTAVKHKGVAAGVAATGVAGTGAAAMGAKKMMGDSEKKGSVTLTPEDVDTLNNLAAAGDLAGFQKAAEAISKAAELPPQFVKKDGDDKKGEEKKDEKGEDKGEKKADGESTEALDLLVETRASELAEGWLRENGYIQGAGE